MAGGENVPYPIDPVCSGGPTRVLNKSFHQLHADDFACKPEIKAKPEYRYVDGVAGGNASIACKVVSVPRATITWHWNGRALHNNSNFSPYQRIVILETGADVERKSVLTLVNAQESDSSQFTCMAENQAGRAETNFTLKVSHRLSGFAILNSSYTAGISVVLIVIIFSILSAIVYLLFRIKKMPPARQIKRSNDEIIPNGTICQSNDNKSLSIEPSIEAKKSSYATAASVGGGGGGGVGCVVGIVPYSTRTTDTTQTLPRLGDLSYRTAMFDDSAAAFESTISSSAAAAAAASGGAYRHTQTSNPDLIADTRYQDGIEAQHVAGGRYTRANDILYPSSLWNQNDIQQFFAKSSSASEFRFDTDDKTPIIEQVSSSPSFYENTNVAATAGSADKQRTTHKDCNQFPTTSSPPDSGSVPAGFNHPHPPNAKTIRVWQKGVQVLPPVTTLKRVLIRASPDE
ncbi:Leucine rich repeat C-terminal domain, partial [Sarracenia purpurea var. burkii]